MSIKNVNLAWATPIRPSGLKLVLVHFADRSDDEGRAHPGMVDTARRCGMSRAQAQRHVKTLVTAGLLSVESNAHGGAPGCTPRYRLQIARLGPIAAQTGSTDATGSMGDTGSTDAADGSHGCGRRVAWMRQTGRMDATQTTMNHQELVGQGVVLAHAPAGAGSAPHPWIDLNGWNDLVANRIDLNLGEILASAEYHYSTGATTDAINEAIRSLRFNRHHKSLSPKRTPAKRTSARRTTSDVGRDTRAADRDYS